MKICTSCKKHLDKCFFFKRKASKDGLRYKCKDCNKIYIKKYYQDNSEKLKECNKEYRQDNPEKLKEYSKKYRQDNPEKLKEYNKKYYQDNLEKLKEYKKRYYKKYPEKLKEYFKWYLKQPHSILKIKARRSVRASLKSGKILKPSICEHCFESKKIQAHHTDYTKPLDIMWFCRSCHSVEHARLNAMNR